MSISNGVPLFIIYRDPLKTFRNATAVLVISLCFADLLTGCYCCGCWDIPHSGRTCHSKGFASSKNHFANNGARRRVYYHDVCRGAFHSRRLSLLLPFLCDRQKGNVRMRFLSATRDHKQFSRVGSWSRCVRCDIFVYHNCRSTSHRMCYLLHDLLGLKRHDKTAASTSWYKQNHKGRTSIQKIQKIFE